MLLVVSSSRTTLSRAGGHRGTTSVAVPSARQRVLVRRVVRPLVVAVTGDPVRFYWARALVARALFFRRLTGDTPSPVRVLGRITACAASVDARWAVVKVGLA